MMHNFINRYLQEVKLIADLVDRDAIEAFTSHIQKIKYQKGRLFFAGVGGSAANCSHAVNDFRKILGIESYCITDNISELTARINDDGWDTSYSRYLQISNINQNDGLIVMSVGGGSESTSLNLVRAMEYATLKQATILSIVSRSGGFALPNSQASILIPVLNDNRITPHAEEWQAVIWHLIVNFLSKASNEDLC